MSERESHWTCLTFGHLWKYFGYHRLHGGDTYICERCGKTRRMKCRFSDGMGVG